MAPNTRKGMTQLLESLPEGEFHDAQDFTDSTTALPARKRKPSQKQLEINEDQHATVSKKLEAMQKEYQELKQQAKKMKAVQSRESAEGENLPSDPSRLSPESEEEDGTSANT
ncbi:hypothetical protein BV20DRAFT_297822 [Pilatotrama ljubarskyi]|nr:hypothetical protein BV20DRAFT_297822 [Pilatotrama ljubarskyi]